MNFGKVKEFDFVWTLQGWLSSRKHDFSQRASGKAAIEQIQKNVKLCLKL